MALKKHQRLRDLCAQQEEGDGQDPRKDRKHQSRKRTRDEADSTSPASPQSNTNEERKDGPLRKIATRAASDAVHAMDASLRVLDVVVDCGGTRISIVLLSDRACDEAMQTRLRLHVRADLARSLNHKRTPEVLLHLIVDAHIKDSQHDE